MMKNTNNIDTEIGSIGQRMLYMIGSGCLTPIQFERLLEKHGINCVVDVRNNDEQGNLSGDVLKKQLNKYGSYYLSFAKEFGILPKTQQKEPYPFDYEKAIRSDNFQRGMERLMRGLERGFHIVLLDEVPHPQDSYRLTLLSHYCRSLGVNVQSIIQSSEPLRYVATKKTGDSEQNIVSKKQTPTHTELGRWGEDIAATYLSAKGYTIVERNWHYRHREIDIIALEPRTGVLCFVEVKTRRNDHFGNPEIAVNYKKMWFLVVAANHYIRSHAIDRSAQFDIIAITGTPQTGYKLDHIPDAIPPSVRTTHR